MGSGTKMKIGLIAEIRHPRSTVNERDQMARIVFYGFHGFARGPVRARTGRPSRQAALHGNGHMCCRRGGKQNVRLTDNSAEHRT